LKWISGKNIPNIFAVELKECRIIFERELPVTLYYKEELVGQ
jgi:hypothetical protein